MPPQVPPAPVLIEPNTLDAKLSASLRGRKWDEVNKELQARGPKAAETLRMLLTKPDRSSKGPAAVDGLDFTDSVVIENLFEAAVIACGDAQTANEDDALFEQIGGLVKAAAERSVVVHRFVVEGLRRRTEGGPGMPLRRRARAAALLIAAGMAGEASQFLPPLEDARRTKDVATLEAHARRLDGQGAAPGGDPRPAWALYRESLAVAGAHRPSRYRIIRRMIALLPSVAEEEGRAWLIEVLSGGDPVDRDLLETMLDEDFSRGDPADSALLQTMNAEFRVSSRLTSPQVVGGDSRERFAAALSNAVKSGKALWGDAPKKLSRAWAADASSVLEELGKLERNPMGPNPYSPYGDPIQSRAAQLTSIQKHAEQLSQSLNAARWVEQLDEETFTRLRLLAFRLRVGAGQPLEALSELDAMGKSAVSLTNEAADQILHYWGLYRSTESKHSQQGGSAAQARNLRELAEVTSRLRNRGVAPSDRTLVSVFNSAHDATEVFRAQDIERVFGSFTGPEFTENRLLQLGELFLRKLVNNWRRPSNQNAVHRNEVQRKRLVASGYEGLDRMISTWSEGRSVTWGVTLLHASALAAYAGFLSDENGEKKDLDAYVKERFPDGTRTAAEYSRDQMKRARAMFRASAGSFARSERRRDEGDVNESLFPAWFEQEFRASRRDTPSDTDAADSGDPFVAIRDAIASLPLDHAAVHRSRFAEYLKRAVFDGSSKIGPDEIYPFLEQALKILPAGQTGIEDLRRLFAFHNFLAARVRFTARIDGDDRRIAVGQPFGLVLSFRHTREIEDEQGGFGRYLSTPTQPQPTAPGYPGFPQPGFQGRRPGG
jgi:hypothetical protein